MTLMMRTAIAAAVLALSSSTSPAIADRTKAFCTLSWYDDSKPLMEGPCNFSQSEGSVYVDDFNFYKFVFPSAEEGKTYNRDNQLEQITLTREGLYTLIVFRKRTGTKPEIKTTQSFPLQCQLNKIASTCRTEPYKAEGFVLFFSHGDQPSIALMPVGPPTTDRRVMIDSTGKRWAMSGHHSFVLEEIGGFGNSISVSSP